MREMEAKHAALTETLTSMVEKQARFVETECVPSEGSQAAKDESSEEEGDYIQSYFMKEFKERVEPIQDLINSNIEELKNVERRTDGHDVEIRRVDNHYDKVCKAICTTQGFQVKDLSSHAIFD